MLVRFCFLGRNCLIDDNPGIKSNNFGWAGQQWIDINFFDFRVISHQIRKPDNRLYEFIQIDRWLTPVTLEERPGFKFLQSPPGQPFIQRRKTK